MMRRDGVVLAACAARRPWLVSHAADRGSRQRGSARGARSAG